MSKKPRLKHQVTKKEKTGVKLFQDTHLDLSSYKMPDITCDVMNQVYTVKEPLTSEDFKYYEQIDKQVSNLEEIDSILKGLKNEFPATDDGIKLETSLRERLKIISEPVLPEFVGKTATELRIMEVADLYGKKVEDIKHIPFPFVMRMLNHAITMYNYSEPVLIETDKEN